jgi:tetratricopeptide (TPR) repeat protein
VEGTERSIEYFEKAIEKDPDYAMAYVGLADSYLVLPFYGPFHPKELVPRAREYAIKALEIDNSIAEAHANLAMLIMYDDRDWGNAEEKMKIALNLNPSYATAHLWYGWLHLWNARFDDAIQELKKAQESDPLSLVINNELGLAYFYDQEYKKAFEQYKKTLEIDPHFIFTYMYLGWGYLQKSMFEEALVQMKKEEDIAKGRNPYIETWIGITYLRMGKKEKVQEILNTLIKKSEQEYVSPYHIALIYFSLGESDKGFEWMDKAYQELDYWLNWIKIEPVLDEVRSDPRFETLLEKLNFK